MWLVHMLQEMKEATQRAQENITIHLPEDDDDDLSEIIAEIRQQYNTKIQQLRSESASEIDTKVRLANFRCSFWQASKKSTFISFII